MSEEVFRIGLIIVDAIIIVTTDSKILKTLGAFGIICLSISLSGNFIQWEY